MDLAGWRGRTQGEGRGIFNWLCVFTWQPEPGVSPEA